MKYASPYGHAPAASTSGTSVKYSIQSAALILADYVATSNISDFTAVSTTLDGATLVEGKLVHVVGQNTGSQNGLRVVDSVSGSTCSLVRARGHEAGDTYAPGTMFQIGGGTNGIGQVWKLAGAAAKTIGTDALTFELLVGSAQEQVEVNLASGILAAGTPLAAFADNASSNPGITLVDSKNVGVRWNNNASQTAVWYSVNMPQGLDDTYAIVFHALCSKTGATVGDATTMTVSAFFQTVAALHDADADCGGATSALVGNATAKTVAELTLSIGASDVPASPSGLSFSIKPTDGTLGTDDFICSKAWFEIRKKLLTA